MYGGNREKREREMERGTNKVAGESKERIERIESDLTSPYADSRVS